MELEPSITPCSIRVNGKKFYVRFTLEKVVQSVLLLRYSEILYAFNCDLKATSYNIVHQLFLNEKLK